MTPGALTGGAGTAILLGVIVLLAVAVGVLLKQYARHVALRRQRGLFGAWPLSPSPPQALGPDFATTPLGPAREAEIRFLPDHGTPGGVSDRESWILGVLAKRARRIFELGTGTGKTTWLLAANAAQGGEVITLALPRDDKVAAAAGDRQDAIAAAETESRNARFYYQDTDVAGRVTQLLADSKMFDEAAYRASCDLVFVDGAHARSFVENDTEKALRMVRPGGWVVWHDYRGPGRTRGVFQALNALARTHELRLIAGTSLVVWRAPE